MVLFSWLPPPQLHTCAYCIRDRRGVRQLFPQEKVAPGLRPLLRPERITVMRSFRSLNEREMLALAIALEEEDARIYDNFADGLKIDYPASAAIFSQMRAEEDGHRHRLLEMYRQKFG